MSKPTMPDDFRPETYEPLSGESDHRISGTHGAIDVHTVVEDFPFYDEHGGMEAVLTTIAYLRPVGDAENRPVMFIWNGGPGCATSDLNLKCFGPWQGTRTPDGKYALTEEPDNLLDVCDLVFMDPAGVGYSRILDPQKRAKYWSIDGDARSCAFALTEWLRRHGRLGSPLYICGESYGTVRACRVVAELGRSPASESRLMLGVPIAGVILIGLATSPRMANGAFLEPGMETLTAALPTMAAVNWYHHSEQLCKESGFQTQEAFVEAAWRLAADEILPARFLGEACPEETISAIAEKLALFTGMKKEYFLSSRLTLRSTEDFATSVVSDEGDRVGISDATVRSPLSGKFNQMGAGSGGVVLMNRELPKLLNIKTNRLYYTANTWAFYQWDNSTEDLGGMTRTHLECLVDAMKENRGLKVLVVSGLYDLITFAGNTRYALTHHGIPKDQLTVKEYPGGHGVYSSAEGKSEFLQDVRALINETSM